MCRLFSGGGDRAKDRRSSGIGHAKASSCWLLHHLGAKPHHPALRLETMPGRNTTTNMRFTGHGFLQNL